MKRDPPPAQKNQNIEKAGVFQLSECTLNHVFAFNLFFTNLFFFNHIICKGSYDNHSLVSSSKKGKIYLRLIVEERVKLKHKKDLL